MLPCDTVDLVQRLKKTLDKDSASSHYEPLENYFPEGGTDEQSEYFIIA